MHQTSTKVIATAYKAETEFHTEKKKFTNIYS